METTVVVTGYSSGGIGFFHAGNGTELGFSAGTSPVLAVVRSGQVNYECSVHRLLYI